MPFNYEWTLEGAKFTKDKGKVFSCFACGGGSTIGYKLAGFDVIGCNEIDPKMIEAYIANHNPKFPFLEPIQIFKNRTDLPEELYNLDVLDGSPPCSSFSMVGNREADWGKEKVFREGQSEQVLDTLFFDFIELGKKLQPKVIIAENVKGIMMGEAWKYIREIYKQFEEAGYYVRHWLLDSSTMGIPQRRERVFFIALRNDLADPFLEQVDMFTQAPGLDLSFKEKKIYFKDVFESYTDRPLTGKSVELWNNKLPEDNGFSEANGRLYNKPNNYFGWTYIRKDDIPPTIIAKDTSVVFDEPRHLNKTELCRIGSYPMDYNFLDNKAHYLIGMSVPPVMVANIAEQVYKQWLSKIQ